jgi:mono/diheme cytochrome c family protein
MQCHDRDGRGREGRETFPEIPDLTSVEWHAKRPDRELQKSILNGKGRTMPSMAKKLSPIEASEMVAFVRAFRGGGLQVVDDDPPQTPVAPSVEPTNPSAVSVLHNVARSSAPALPARRRRPPVAGLEIYRGKCETCHGADGRGTAMRSQMPSLPDFSLSTWQVARSDVEVSASILEGKGENMPGWRGRISADQIRVLVEVLRSFGPSVPPSEHMNTRLEFEEEFRSLLERMEELQRQVEALQSPA